MWHLKVLPKRCDILTKVPGSQRFLSNKLSSEEGGGWGSVRRRGGRGRCLCVPIVVWSRETGFLWGFTCEEAKAW